MDLLLSALYCNEHWGEEGKQGREVASLSFTNPTFTILNQPAHTTPCHEHDALTMWWYSIGQHFCSWSQAKIYFFSMSQHNALEWCWPSKQPLTMDLIKQLMPDGHADQFWSPGPDYVSFQFFCPAANIWRAATLSETSGEQRIILINVDRRNRWLWLWPISRATIKPAIISYPVFSKVQERQRLFVG